MKYVHSTPLVPCTWCEKETRLRAPTRRLDIDDEDGVNIPLCHTCCVETGTLANGYTWTKNILSGKPVMIHVSSKGNPAVDPAFERYHTM
jgi:hypothetical protein